jgi:hypothetical protein
MFQPDTLRGELCGDLRKKTLRGPDFRHRYQAAPANAFFYHLSSPGCGPDVRSVRPMSPSAVRHERVVRPRAGESGTLPRPDAGEPCAVRRNASLKSELQTPTQYSYRLPERGGGSALRAPQKCVLYPRTELMQSKACSAGIAARRAGFGGRNDAECRQ